MKYIEWSIERLDELVSLWNKEISAEFPMRVDLFKQNSFDDINIFHDGSLIAIDDEGNVRGFVVSKLWQDSVNVGISKETGWIQVLLVARDYRNQGIGTKLLNHAEGKFREKCIKNIWLGKDTWHYFPGIPQEYKSVAKWFEKNGYIQVGEEFDLDCYYENNQGLEIVEKEEVEISLVRIDEKEEFLEFMHRCFPGRWEYEAIQYFQLGGTGREFVVLKKNNRIIGFCRVNDSKSPVIAQNVYWAPLYKGELGGIGPLGIDANERKHGYGLYIVEAAVQELRKRGTDSIVIDWTGLVDFYRKLGYEVCKSYYSYHKNI
ncbi:GNAT family N-acetyltransferase [Ornithinibacillus halophilus]|uniref:Acetyltransferase, GNAT family n=1 Tax=Ornithinibacillus halophilus TaxID=930117 RepID=A0A1M5K2H2_9BACI|nr:GNAT family N-acetyltransferase [Ornithinibacillus halophilus]SHG46729.1 Acetyltransferase, GNAT family [Ornithinibacillus halophilus]